MNMFKCLSVAMVLAMSVVQPAFAKGDDKKEFVIVNEAVGVPVFPHDITDRPYEVVGDVKAGVRKATIFSKEASQEKIYKELWERAEKLDADAVINAKYGDSHVTAFSWGKTNATALRSGSWKRLRLSLRHRLLPPQRKSAPRPVRPNRRSRLDLQRWSRRLSSTTLR